MKKARKFVGHYLSYPLVFRPSYGKITVSLWFYTKLMHYKIVYWTIDSGDTYKYLPDIELIVDKVIKDKGGVILLHSFDRKPNGDNRQEYVLKLTLRLIEIARQQNLKICTCSELE